MRQNSGKRDEGRDHDDCEAFVKRGEGRTTPGAKRKLLLNPLFRSRETLRGVRRRLAQAPSPFAPRLVTYPLAMILAAGVVAPLVFLRYDEAVSLAMLDEPPGVVAFLTYATDVGLVRWYVYPAFALILLLSVIDWSAASRYGRVQLSNVYAHAAFLFASISAAGVVTNILKILFGRARPALLDEHGGLAFDAVRFGHEFASFPSGHSTTMGAVTIVLAIWFPRLRLALLCAGFAFAMTRIVVRAHYPSDVAAGLAIGMTTAILTARALARRRIVYGFRHGGAGWRGLLPVRLDRTRDLDRMMMKKAVGRIRKRSEPRPVPDAAPQSRPPDPA